MLRPQGLFYMINRAEAVTEILHNLHGKTGAITLIPLYSKPEQEAKRIMVIAKKDSRAPTKILPGITIHTPDSQYTKEAHQILRLGLGYFDKI